MIEAIKRIFKINNQLLNYNYLFEIHLNEVILLTDSSYPVKLNNNIYNTYSGMKMLNYIKTDSGDDYMKIEGFFHPKGIKKSADLNNKNIIVSLYKENKKTMLASLYVTDLIISGDKFMATLNPASILMRNNLTNKFFSKTCRAKFAGKECGVKLEDICYKTNEFHMSKNVIILQNPLSNKYRYSFAEISGERNFKIKIIKILDQKIIHLAEEIEILNPKKLSLTPYCDKSFESCINIFNNSINFRGEPHIPEIIKSPVS